MMQLFMQLKFCVKGDILRINRRHGKLIFTLFSGKSGKHWELSLESILKK